MIVGENLAICRWPVYHTVEYGKNMLKLRGSLRVVLAACFVHGCAAYKLSSPLLPLEEQQGGKAMFQSLVLGIGSPLDKSQSFELGRFVDDLKKTGLFKAVDYNDRVAAADLILTSFSYKETDPFEACPLGLAGQIVTIGTIGLVPQICNANNEVSFVLYSPKDDLRKKKFSFAYQTKTILGWAALFYTPSSAWSAQPSKNERADLLKAVFLHEAPEIQKMLR
jgi:hypothetical protein